MSEKNGAADVEAPEESKTSLLAKEATERKAAEQNARREKERTESTAQRVKDVAAHPTVAPEFAEVSNTVKEAREAIKKGNKPNQSAKLDALKEEVTMDEHTIDLEDLVARLGTDVEKGLSTEVADARNKEYGYNELTPPKRTPWYVTLLKIMFFGFAAVLWIGSVLSFMAYGIELSRNGDASDFLALGVVLAGVNIITGFFSFYQNYQSDSVSKKFAAMTASRCTVIRDGMKKSMDPKFLTIGDLVEVKNGQKIPADLRITKCEKMKVDNSSFTGETEPQGRSTECSNENPLETKNIAMYTTACVDGSGYGIVIKIGDDSIIGRIAGLVSGTKKRDSPLSHEIESFIHLITFIALFLAVTIVVAYLVKEAAQIETAALKAIVIFIAILVANVPEGLLATITVALTITKKKMASQKCVVKASECVETLGSTSTICSDKTGTLTQNLMTVAHVWYDNQIFTTKTSVTEATYSDKDKTYSSLFDVLALNTTAEFDAGQEDVEIQDRKTLGDASESAMLKFCTYAKDVTSHRAKYPRVGLVPFNSTNKWMLSIHKLEDGSHKIVMKGAPERVLNVCSHFLVNGERQEKNDTNVADWQKAYDDLGGMGERVLGCAEFNLPKDEYPEGFEFDTENFNFPKEGYSFVGLVALIDPPRAAVPAAVQKCREAGIRVIMVTGDHPITAKAIAKQVGIISLPTREDIAAERKCAVDEVDKSDARAIVLHGQDDLVKLDKYALRDVLSNHDEIVFARTSPQQKLIIVEACQNNGWVVAVTGDGVNDSPALKQADIGVAMGISGSDVSIEAADMVLLDDNFATIVVGIEAGRLIFDNLKKSIAYTLTSNIPEITPSFFYIFGGIPNPLGTITILAIDLGTDLWPAISLAYEEAESDIMLRKPRDAEVDKLVNSRLMGMTYLQIGFIQACAGFFSYFTVYTNYGFHPYILWGLVDRESWEAPINNYLEDSYGQHWNYDARIKVQNHANTAFFVSIVIVQWADVTICKTRKLSLLQQGMKNQVLNGGILFETLLAVVLCYTPQVNYFLKTYPIEFVHWLPALPFSLAILIFDEVRKSFIRKYPGGFVEQETYY